MYATNYFETMVLGLLRGQSAQAPAAIYVGLLLNNPGETGAGTEVSYAGYARQQVTFSTPAPLNGGTGVQSLTDLTFPISPVALGAITHLGLYDSAAGGNMLAYNEFTESLTVDANEAPVVVAGEMQWWIIGQMSVAFRTRVLNLLRGQNANGFSPYLALYNGDPESGGAELSGDNYARLAIPFTAPAEQTGGQMQIQNSTELLSNRASGTWGILSYLVVFDSSTAGTPAYAYARTAKEVRKGVMLQVPTGELKLSFH